MQNKTYLECAIKVSHSVTTIILLRTIVVFTFCLQSIKFFFMNMYVANLGLQVTDQELKTMFSQFGEVTSAKVINDRETGTSRGFAFVEMADELAEKAMKALDGTQADGKTLSVSKAKPKSNTGSFPQGRSSRW